MTGFRLLLAAVYVGFCAGCAVGAPQRANDLQNVNGIADDISATTMTQSDMLRAHDPNIVTTLPNRYQVVHE